MISTYFDGNVSYDNVTVTKKYTVILFYVHCFGERSYPVVATKPSRTSDSTGAFRDVYGIYLPIFPAVERLEMFARNPLLCSPGITCSLTAVVESPHRNVLLRLNLGVRTLA